MTEQAPAVPSHRYTTCATCTNEVRVDFSHEGPAQCEFCSGEMKGYHQILREQRKAAEEARTRAGDSVFMERVGAVLKRSAPNPYQPGALGRCPTCLQPFSLADGRIIHGPRPCVKPRER